MINWDGTISLGDVASALVSVASVAAAIVTFLVQQSKSDDLQRTEIYQRLEFASSDVFSFEAEQAERMEKFRDLKPQPEKFGEAWAVVLNYKSLEAAHMDGLGPDIRQAYYALEDDVRVVRKYYEKSLNLFEVATRFRRQGIVDEQVFGSWVVWYFETAKEWGFRWMWDDLLKNYTSELREIFEYPLNYFDWYGEKPEVLERDFFIHVARTIKCSVIADWRETVAEAREKLHADVESLGHPKYGAWPRSYGDERLPEPRRSPNRGPLAGVG